MATGLKLSPADVGAMTCSDAFEILDYWQSWPPEHELIAILTSAYTDWEPESRKNMTEQELQIEHRKSLERRWAAGALNVKDLMSMGGLPRGPALLPNPQ